MSVPTPRPAAPVLSPTPAALSATERVVLRAISDGNLVVAVDVINCRHVERLGVVDPVTGDAVDAVRVVANITRVLIINGLAELGPSGAVPWSGGPACGYRLRLTSAGQLALHAFQRNATRAAAIVPAGRLA